MCRILLASQRITFNNQVAFISAMVELNTDEECGQESKVLLCFVLLPGCAICSYLTCHISALVLEECRCRAKFCHSITRAHYGEKTKWPDIGLASCTMTWSLLFQSLSLPYDLHRRTQCRRYGHVPGPSSVSRDLAQWILTSKQASPR